MGYVSSFFLSFSPLSHLKTKIGAPAVHSMGFSSGGLYKLRTELAEIEMERLREDQDRLRCEDAIKMEKRLSVRLRKEIQEREFALSVERNAYDNVDKIKPQHRRR